MAAALDHVKRLLATNMEVKVSRPRRDKKQTVSSGLSKIKQTKGMTSALARHLNIKRQAVSGWRAVPIGRLADVEKFTGIPREKLRPDIFRQ
jgi:hypothetical protein